MDWDHYRYFLELARTGRLTSAARRLGVDQATVSRRVQNLEKQLNTTLFSRSASGMEMTEAAHDLMAHVEAMEAAQARIAGISPRPSDGLAGIVRVGATEGFGASILAPHLGAFASRYPQLTIDLIAVSAVVNISRREADIVISLERPKRGPFVVTKLCDYVLHIYGSRSYLASHPIPRAIGDLKQHALIGYMDDLLFSNQLQFFSDLETPQRFALRSTSVMAQISATASGAGLAILPAFLADRDPRLQPVLKSEVKVLRTFWMSMPEELRHLPRIRATWDFIRQAVDSESPTLLSTVPPAP